MRIAIDASNIRTGGGVTHLVECLNAYEPDQHQVSKVVVYGGRESLDRLPITPWLDKRTPREMERGGGARFWWRQCKLTAEVSNSADVLLVPGGTYLNTFRPFVALAQNLLPFDNFERAREGLSLKRLRLHLLGAMQGRTFRRAAGVIFMTDISRSHIETSLGFRAARTCVVHHGVGPSFVRKVKLPRPRNSFTEVKPFRLLYVSILERYKHQDVVVEAVAGLRRCGIAVALDLVGPGSKVDQMALKSQMRRLDPNCAYLRYHGMVPYAGLSSAYESADAFVFASSCETFGIILLEAMAGGLPIICSHRSAMPEVVGTAAVFFDPLNADSLAAAIKRLYYDDGLRRSLAFQAREQSRLFSWEKCAKETFGFVREVYESYRNGKTL